MSFKFLNTNYNSCFCFFNFFRIYFINWWVNIWIWYLSNTSLLCFFFFLLMIWSLSFSLSPIKLKGAQYNKKTLSLLQYPRIFNGNNTKTKNSLTKYFIYIKFIRKKFFRFNICLFCVEIHQKEVVIDFMSV